MPLGHAGLPPGRQLLCRLSLELPLCPEPAGSGAQLIQWVWRLPVGQAPVNAVRTRVFGSSLLPLIRGIRKMQVGWVQKVHGGHVGFVPLGNLAEEMFCGVLW